MQNVGQLIAQRDALQAKLDDALAQVAMLRGALGNLYWVVTCAGMSDSLARLGNPCNAYVKNASQILEQTKPIAEAYKAELLKPWREAVTVLRGAVDDQITAISKSPKGSYIHPIGLKEALEATEGLS